MVDVMFRNKPIYSLTREEAIEALKQALDRVAELEGLPAPFMGIPLHVSPSIPPGTLIAMQGSKEVGRIVGIAASLKPL